ncbi:flagellin [Rossellomorea sp. BNER]|uniref:flagellin N-terminal helical domain-containing protein n=1 Tax=Rossellomorea sp. BNER TaxID=2962031 RepID=UPI003AF2C9C6
MRINHNIAALNTYRQLNAANNAQSSSMEKLSSGLRINKAGDDAAGLAISEKMRGQIRGLDMAAKNAQDGISLISTAEGALNETHSILQRMRELAVQSANDTNTSSDRSEIQKEIDQLSKEVTRISTDTEFNTKKLLNGDMGKTYAVTANTMDSALQNVKVTGSDITTGTYTITATAAGTDTVTLPTNTAATGFDNTDITVADGTKFGNYKLNVTNHNGTTADFELIGPDGKSTVVTGKADDGDLAIGGITFAFSSNAVTSNGTLEFSLTNSNIDFDLSGAKTVTASPITSYAGETINLGGIEFEARWGAATNGDVLTLNVTDKAVKFHIGANEDQNTSLSINDMSASALGVNALVVTTQTGANTAIETINKAIETVSGERSKLGAYQNRLEHTINNLGTSSENLTAAESRIRDVDYAIAA